LKNIYDLPAIFFSFDEQSGSEGFRTRLEAFVDLMEAKREQKLNKNTNFKVKNYNDLCDIHGSPFYKECLQLIQTK
jgi:predicted nucleotide-binding protein (sugar kinase/HSP70/actin superfamily)